MIINKITELDENALENKTILEYLSFKKANMEYIILFQIGDFFETFFEDAKIFSRITSAMLSCRAFQNVGKILEAGIPKRALNNYVKMLLQENCKVCVCAQFKTEDNKVYREITRKYTGGTIIEDEFLDSSENNYILSLYSENNLFYLAYADVSTGQIYKTSGKIESLSFEIEKISPCEILISHKQQEIFKDYISEYPVTIFSDEYFSSKTIEKSIYEYCLETQKKYSVKLDEAVEYKISSYMQMDDITRRNLELTKTKRLLKRKGSIFWFLNSTKTPMGQRLLKKYINEPLLDINIINQRQSAVCELISKQEILSKLENVMDNFCDLSRLCAKISNSTILPKNLYQISENADFLSEIFNICEKLDSPLLKINEKELSKTEDFILELKSAIPDDPSSDLKSGNIIKEGYDANLDYLKDKLKTAESKLSTYVKKESARLNIEKMNLSKSNTIGYFIEVPSSKINHIPYDYIKKQTLSNCARYTNDIIKKYEQEIFNLIFQINQLEYDLFCNLRKKAQLFVDTIRNLAKDIAQIDVLSTFARCAIDNKFIKPKFNKNGIYIKNGYHPSLIKLGNEIVKNDIMLDNNSTIILTGANMSGKSTFLKQNAIICLFSQIGAFVPADSADITITDKIFFRQGITDDIINNNSSFMVEMNDLKFVIENSTDKSLILLDEPAKSTNEREGGAIARAFVEYIVNNIKSKMIVVTHNHQLTNIEATYKPKVQNFMMESFSNPNGIMYSRKIKKGAVESSFALDTAELADLPVEIIDRAKEILLN